MADTVVVIRCMDKRFQNEWVARMLQKFGDHYAIGLVGGVQSVQSPAGVQSLREQLQKIHIIFSFEEFQRIHFVLLAHQECKAYEHEKTPVELQNADLIRGDMILRRILDSFSIGVPTVSRHMMHIEGDKWSFVDYPLG